MNLAILTKPIAELTEGDLLNLVAQDASEGLRLDYKRDAPRVGTTEDKLEFLSDVSSFANSSGGTILYGIAEDDGLPVAPFAGLDPVGWDAKTLQLRQILEANVKPRMPGVEIGLVALASGRKVLVIRVRRSWLQPHMVKVKAAQRFFSRRHNGKMELEIHEIRAAFLGSELEVDRVRDFRTARLSAIASGEGVPALTEGARLVLHLVPLTAGMIGISQVDLYEIGPGSQSTHFPLLAAHSGWGSQWNFDGFICSNQDRRSVEAASSYTQVFRSGSIEAVTTETFAIDRAIRGREVRGIYCYQIESAVVDFTAQAFRLLQKSGAEPPYFGMLSLLSVQGYENVEWLSPRRVLLDQPPSVARNDILLPEVLFETFEEGESPEIVYRPAFDVLWQATGFPQSLSWNGGEWDPR